MRRGWNGGELEVKDLQSMWDTLYEEEGVRWSSADTVVFTEWVFFTFGGSSSAWMLISFALTATPLT